MRIVTMTLRGPIRSLASIALLLSAPALLHAQEIPSDKCGTPKEPIGVFKGSGSVRYQLGKNGVPDTASVEVLVVENGTAAGFRSIAVRQLAACKMQHPAAALLVVQHLRFDSVAKVLPVASPATGSETPLTLEQPAPPAAGMIFAANDGALEERPRWAACDRAPHTKVVTTSARSPSTENYSGDPADFGLVTATLVLGADGRVMKDSLALVRSDNPQSTSKIMRSLATCRFAPGRIAGVPVPTRIEATMSLSPGGYSVWDMPAGRAVLSPH